VRGKLLRKRYFSGFDKILDPKEFNFEEWISQMAAA